MVRIHAFRALCSSLLCVAALSGCGEDGDNPETTGADDNADEEESSSGPGADGTSSTGGTSTSASTDSSSTSTSDSTGEEDSSSSTGTSSTSSSTGTSSTSSTSSTTTTETSDTGETGDDTGDGTDGGDPPDAVRYEHVAILDPHFYASVLGLICTDITNLANDGVNAQLASGIQGDDPDMPDGYLDLSFMLLFRPLDQTSASGTVEFANGLCTAPIETTTCELLPDSETVLTTYENVDSGNCLEPVMGELSSEAYDPRPQATAAPCFTAHADNLELDVGSFAIPLIDVTIGAKFEGDPATGVTNGLLRGFLTEATAEATVLPSDILLVGGKKVSELLPGGVGGCAGHSDKDMREGEPGWWMYIEFSGGIVPYTE